MKYLIFNRKNLLFATLMATAFGVNAQIESKHTDEKYGYTTVVYKEKAATDADVLAALENSVGMGDVIRVTVAPPKPAAAPQADKSKGEDTWLKPAKTTTNLTASAIVVPINHISPKAVVAAPKAAPLAPSPTPTAVANKEIAPKPAAVQEMVISETPTVLASSKTVRTKSSGSSKSSKSVKKSVKRKKSSYNMKRRKPGKQRYKCPKF